DVGGAPGYAEYLDAISDPAHPEHENMRRWGPAQAQVLDVVSGYPLLGVHYFPSAADVRPILAGQNLTRADRFTYTFTSRAE
ncbi:DNA-binding GntR family transcriptional regulator, partial [Bradyrhizobium sp. RT6a]